MSIRMFCGELKGELQPSQMGFRADDVRYGIAVMSEPGLPYPAGWAKAKREGWRVVPVFVTKAHPSN